MSKSHFLSLTDEVPATLELFLERLKNEITRLTTVKSLQLIAESQRVDILPILSRAMPVLANFLRKNQRSLKISTLRCLDRIFRNYSRFVQFHFVDQNWGVGNHCRKCLAPKLSSITSVSPTSAPSKMLGFELRLPSPGADV